MRSNFIKLSVIVLTVIVAVAIESVNPHFGLGEEPAQAVALPSSNGQQAIAPVDTHSVRYQSLKIVTLNDATQNSIRLGLLINKWLEEKGFNNSTAKTTNLYTLTLLYDAAVKNEGYCFMPTEHGATVKASCLSGLYAGAGHFLLKSQIKDGKLLPPDEFYASIPQKEIRGMYFATHFKNFYESAPAKEVQRYTEEMALWGYNILTVGFGAYQFTGMDDQYAVATVSHIRSILEDARVSGMKLGFFAMVNAGFSTTPDTLKADWHGGENGYLRNLTRYRVDAPVCPSVPGGMELILKNREEIDRAFQGIDVDYLVLWPYDHGGCTCSKCAPWGVNGYLRTAPHVVDVVRKDFPNIKPIMSLWHYDLYIDGEVDAFKKTFRNEGNYVNYILCDFYELQTPIPKKLLVHNNEVCGLPLVGFPDISMQYHDPWGGYGANPTPQHIKKLWELYGGEMQGGFPYSEGIFEDVNKFIISQLYWYGNYDVNTALKEYVSAYFSKEYAEDIAECLSLMETTLPRRYEKSDSGINIEILRPDSCDLIYNRIMKLDTMLSSEIRGSWRWRIVYLRAVIDKELSTHHKETMACLEAYKELIEIYYAEKCVRPPLFNSPEINESIKP